MAIMANDILYFAFRGSCFGQRIMLTQWYQATGTGNPSTTLVQDFAEWRTAIDSVAVNDLTSQYLALFGSDYELQELRFQRIKPVRSAYTSFVPTTQAGTFDGETGTAANSAAITYRTILAGRDQVSTKKIGPLPEEASVAGLIADTYAELLQTFAANLMSNIALVTAAVELVPGIFHPVANTFTPFASFLLQDTSRTMSRRVVGRGE